MLNWMICPLSPDRVPIGRGFLMPGGTVPDPTYAVGDRVWYDGSEIGPGTVTRVDAATIYVDLDSGHKAVTSWPHLEPLADHTP